jgi:hypothetical protein
VRVRENHQYAVMTGDVVGFSGLPENRRTRLLDLLREAHGRLRQHYGDGVSPRIDVFRGDSWQFVVSEPGLSLRVALFFRAFMISQDADTRVAIGIGAVDFLPSKHTPTGDGEAFRRSGTALDTMRRGERLVIEGPAVIRSMDSAALDVLVSLLDAIVRGWTPRQAEAVCGAILGWNQQQIASKWEGRPITQQAVAQHLERARWNAVARTIEHFEVQCRSVLG